MDFETALRAAIDRAEIAETANGQGPTPDDEMLMLRLVVWGQWLGGDHQGLGTVEQAYVLQHYRERISWRRAYGRIYQLAVACDELDRDGL